MNMFNGVLMESLGFPSINLYMSLNKQICIFYIYVWSEWWIKYSVALSRAEKSNWEIRTHWKHTRLYLYGEVCSQNHFRKDLSIHSWQFCKENASRRFIIFLSFGIFQLCVQHKQQVESRSRQRGCSNYSLWFCEKPWQPHVFSLLQAHDEKWSKTTADEYVQKEGPWGLRTGD